MAAVSIPSAEVSLSKRVQETVLTGEDPLGPYVCRNEDDNTEEESPENSPIPIFDLGCFLPQKSSTKETEENLEKLKSALYTWRCFQAIGHWIPNSFLDNVRQVGREFFEQPMEEKNKYAKPVTVFEGYGTDPVPEEGQPLDWSNHIFIKLVPEDRRNYRLWPLNPTSFKFNYYSPCKRPDLVLGLRSHADGSGNTILMHHEPGATNPQGWEMVYTSSEHLCSSNTYG